VREMRDKVTIYRRTQNMYGKKYILKTADEERKYIYTIKRKQKETGGGTVFFDMV
jgi:hypothetical protein